MQFTKLRLAGFKSFVDPTELLIEPGITGIVGPNGCGKSNLVEAMKWVMGETSARQMRGGGMDDVIFSGTSGRPARNVAEVALELDNTDGTAPSQFNEFPELEVVRRIEREKGSTFKINSRDKQSNNSENLFGEIGKLDISKSDSFTILKISPIIQFAATFGLAPSDIEFS